MKFKLDEKIELNDHISLPVARVPKNNQEAQEFPNGHVFPKVRLLNVVSDEVEKDGEMNPRLSFIFQDITNKKAKYFKTFRNFVDSEKSEMLEDALLKGVAHIHRETIGDLPPTPPAETLKDFYDIIAKTFNDNLVEVEKDGDKKSVKRYYQTVCYIKTFYDKDNNVATSLFPGFLQRIDPKKPVCNQLKLGAKEPIVKRVEPKIPGNVAGVPGQTGNIDDTLPDPSGYTEFS